jgi:hypothetical protein
VTQPAITVTRTDTSTVTRTVTTGLGVTFIRT